MYRWRCNAREGGGGGTREKPDQINEDGVEKKGGQRKSAGLNREGGRYSTSRVNLRELMTCEVLIDAL